MERDNRWLLSLAAIVYAYGLFLLLPAPSATAEGDRPDILRVGVSHFPPGRGHPYSGIFVPGLYAWSAIYDSLTRMTHKGTLEPWLATSWESVNNVTWRFTVRDGVEFANAEPFDAYAVVNAIKFLIGDGATTHLGRELIGLKGAHAVDSRTVDIVLTTANPLLPRDISYMMIPAPRAWTELGPQSFVDKPIGTGPYAAQSWDSARAAFEAAPSSWRRAPSDRLEILALPEPTARVQGVRAGTLDLIVDIAPEDETALVAGGGKLVPLPFPGVWAIMLNSVKDTPTKDPRVRQALNYAVDKQTIIDTLLNGATVIASQPASRADLGYADDVAPYPYDPDRAKELLKEAGYPDGFDMIMEAITGAGANDALVSQQVAADLARVGVNVEVRPLNLAQLSRRVQSGEWDGTAFPMSFFTTTFDATRPLRRNSCLWHAPWYCDEDIMPTLVAALEESDLTKRMELTQTVMRRAHEQAQAIFLYEGLGFMGIGPRIETVEAQIGYIIYENIKFVR